MPKRVNKVCNLCGRKHPFKRSMLKAAKRGNFGICFWWQIGSRR